jgi:hypothetical protein
MHLEQSTKEELKTYRITSKLSELLCLFSNGNSFYEDLDRYLEGFEYSFDNRSELQKLADELEVDYEDVRDVFYENVIFSKSRWQVAVDAIEAYITYKLEHNSDVSISLNMNDDNETIIATIKTKHTLDHLISKGMSAYGDFDYDAHSDEDKDTLKNDFYYILKYLIYYYIACNGGARKPYLKIEQDLDNFWTWPNEYQLEKLCKERFCNGD